MWKPYPVCHTTKMQKYVRQKGEKQEIKSSNIGLWSLDKRDPGLEAMCNILPSAILYNWLKNVIAQTSKVATSLINPIYFQKGSVLTPLKCL